MNRKNALLSSVLLAFMLVLAVGCADPAADKPAAEVQEPAPAPAAAPEPAAEEHVVYSITEDSTVGFIGSKVTGSHEGGFNTFSGEVHVVGGTPEGSSVVVNIDTTSLWSDNENLTGHLKSPDFFEVETYPTSTFSSTEITSAADGGYTITGNLTLHGVTKQITFPATIEMADGMVNANAEFSVKRFDFGIVYPGKAEDLIRDDVVINLALKAAPQGSMADDAMGDDTGDDAAPQEGEDTAPQEG